MWGCDYDCILAYVFRPYYFEEFVKVLGMEMD